MRHHGQVAKVNVLYEDNHLLVVVKPYGVPSQADETGDEDMLSLCKAYIGEKYGKPGNVYLGLVHRLDRPTSGVMVFARTSKAAARLSAQMQNGAFEKTYLAVLTAVPPDSGGELWHYLKKDEKTHIAGVSDRPIAGAKKAGLEYTVLAEKDGLILVRVKLLTGRFHQIRAQFAHVGAAVYGDMKYGARNVKAPLALFASRISFDHPTTGERMTFTAKPEGKAFQVFEI